jgi:hypothetical protein
MDYRQAKNIREKSFGTLLAEQKGGFGSSLKAAISQKTKARVTGFKEKFDPLNIVKTLTGGSNLAPALLGKLFNMDKKRVDYFSGVKPKNSANLQSSESFNSPEAIESLGYIYKSLKQSANDKKMADEQKRNKLEEEDYEEEYRNQEIVKALTARFGKKSGEKEKRYRDEKGRFAKKPTEEKTRTTTNTPNGIKIPKTRTTTNTPNGIEIPKTFDVVPQVRNAGASVASTATKVAGMAAITALGVSKAAAISIKGETGSTNIKEILQKGSQIVPNDPKPGVFSYGIFGMNSGSGTVDQFIAQNPQFGFREKPGTPAFNEEWKRISANDPQAFFDAQIKWHDKNIVKPLEKDLKKMLPSNIPLDDRILTYMADRRIQYGKTLETSAFEYASTATNSDDFITKITDFDLSTIGRAFKTYLSTNPGAEKGLRNRIENRRTLSMELTKNDIGNRIDSSSNENKNLKADINASNDKPAPIITNNSINSQQQKQITHSSPEVDDTSAYHKKARGK